MFASFRDKWKTLDFQFVIQQKVVLFLQVEKKKEKYEWVTIF